MNAIDPRDLSDRDLLVHLLLGELPRYGWERRGALVRRMLQVAALTVLIAALVIVASVGVVLLWAATL